MTRKCALFLFDGYADWEPALAITGLKNFGGFKIVTFSELTQPIISMGGIKILPDKSIENINPKDYDLLILPGGEAWEKGGNREIIPLVKDFNKQGKYIAAICGATLGLAHSGLFNTQPHTSNALHYLKELCPSYQGDQFYEHKPCVNSGNLITANGAAMIEFAIELYKIFNIADFELISAVSDLYKSGGMDNRLYQSKS